MKKSLKRLFNSLLGKFGYQMIHVTTLKQQEETKEYTLDQVFNFFPRWISKFELNNKIYGGDADYGTKRVSMLNEEELQKFIDFKGKTVIEFGPLEGGNTMLLEKLSAKSIIAIEGKIENFIKCCVIKNLYKLDCSTFYYDNAKNTTLEKYGRYDIAFIAGILYHLDSPHVFLNELGKMSNQIVLSTHYADEESPSPHAEIKAIQQNGNIYRGKLYKEQISPCSGLQSFSFWPFKEDLLNMLNHAGYKKINIIRESTDRETKYKLIYLIANKS